MNFFSGTWAMGKSVAVGAILAALAGIGPLKAADDLPIIGDIPMPEVNVDVRIGDDIGLAPRPLSRLGIAYPRGPFAPIPPARYEADIIDRPAVSPHQVAVILRSTGYSLLGGINRRGWVYTVAVIDPRGDDGRAIIDARTGAIIRFIPALAVNARLNDELGVVYGPAGPPPALHDFRGALRSPKSVPQAQRNTGAKLATAPAIAKPSPSKGKTADARAEMTPASTPQQQAAPPAIKLWPTQAMPEVQLLD